MGGNYRQGPWICLEEKYIVNFKNLNHLVLNYHEKKLKQHLQNFDYFIEILLHFLAFFKI